MALEKPPLTATLAGGSSVHARATKLNLRKCRGCQWRERRSGSMGARAETWTRAFRQPAPDGRVRATSVADQAEKVGVGATSSWSPDTAQRGAPASIMRKPACAKAGREEGGMSRDTWAVTRRRHQRKADRFEIMRRAGIQ